MDSSAIVVTHNAEEAMFLSNVIVVMEKGSIVQIGKPREIYFNPSNVYVASLFGEVNIFKTKILNNKCETPLGILDTKDFKDNQQVNVVVRPEAIKLNVCLLYTSPSPRDEL